MWKLTGQTMMSADVHTIFAVMHLPLASIGKAYILSFDKLVCRIIKERLSACHMATVTEIILISEFHALH